MNIVSKIIFYTVTISSFFGIHAAQQAPGNRGRAIPMAYDRAKGDWSILLGHKKGDPAHVFTDFAAPLQANKLANMIATEALSAQTNGVYANRILIQTPHVGPTVLGDTFYFVQVPYKSGYELYQQAQNNLKDDFMWISASDILNKRDIIHPRRGRISISNAVDDVLRRNLAQIIQQLNQQQATTPAAQPASQPAIAQTMPAAGQTWLTIPGAILFYESNKPYYEFTNFYMSPVTIDGKVWPTTEHYFQAQKFADSRVQEKIRNLPSARDAFNEGRNRANTPRPNWDAIKIGVMEKAVRAKFAQNPNLQRMLLNTGNRTIVENAGANDTFWGAGADGRGNNYLGRILMHVRDELRAGAQQPFRP